jgi:hypothetical protein
VEATLQKQKFPKLSQFLCRKMAKLRQEKNTACNMKGYLILFYSHIFESRQIWLNKLWTIITLSNTTKLKRKKP